MSALHVFMTAESARQARSRRAYLIALVAVAAISLGVVGCSKPGPGSAKTSDELLTQLKDDRHRIDETTDTMMKRIDMFNASRKPGEQTLQFAEIFNQDLSPEQRDVLNQLVEQERDVSYKALLQKIIADRETIQGLQENVARMEQSLSDKFVMVKKGDKQQNLAMNYLTTEANLDPEKAKSLLSQVDTSDELLPGNRVWFFYDPKQDIFRTYVTQGEAGQTPLAVRRAKQRRLIRERDTLKAEVSTLQVNKAELETTVGQLNDDIAARENSLYYHAANEKTLKDEGVLSPVLKRVQNVRSVSYDESLDLRQGTTITLTPETYGLQEIRHVKLLPTIYQEGRDFTIEKNADNSQARLVILDPDLFRGKEVLLVIGG
ncbi:MAG TPA: hypothetical protein VFW45_13760 [Candidatus Polarisedimenticolia bacterium]|nr:hypothetical protein [Candidatus Polarisedimenticolia bacterium]